MKTQPTPSPRQAGGPGRAVGHRGLCSACLAPKSVPRAPHTAAASVGVGRVSTSQGALRSAAPRSLTALVPWPSSPHPRSPVHSLLPTSICPCPLPGGLFPVSYPLHTHFLPGAHLVPSGGHGLCGSDIERPPRDRDSENESSLSPIPPPGRRLALPARVRGVRVWTQSILLKPEN